MQIDRVRVGITNTYLVRDSGAILVDSGEPGRAAAVLRKLRSRVGPLPDIRLLLLTHGHLDHTGNADALKRETGARVAIHEGDAGWLTRGDLAIPDGLTPWGRLMGACARRVIPRLLSAPAVAPDIVLADDLSLAVYGIAGRVVHTPGHTPGSITLLLESGDAIVGDLVMNGLPFCLRPSLAVIGDSRAELEASWRHLLDLGARTIHPGHGRPFQVDALAAERQEAISRPLDQGLSANRQDMTTHRES